MAKQRGIHQISGKVNNLCYYEQKYVRGGLIRRINEAMSLRLKEDPVFENTRKANSIFGCCSILSSTFFEAFGLGSREMYVPSVQAKFTSALLKIWHSKVDSITLGEGYPSDDEVLQLVSTAFNSLGKGNKSQLSSFFSTWLHDYPTSDSGLHKVVIPRGVMVDYCAKYGSVRAQVNVYKKFCIGTPLFTNDSGKYIKYGYSKLLKGPAEYWSINDGDLEIELDFESGSFEMNFILVFIYPIVPTPDGSTDRYGRGGFYRLIPVSQ